MFEIRKPEEKSVVVIRTATPHELSSYEKWKLESVEEGAQVNKLEMIKISTPSMQETFANIENKVAKVNLGDLALKSKITQEDISQENTFLIECTIDN